MAPNASRETTFRKRTTHHASRSTRRDRHRGGGLSFSARVAGGPGSGWRRSSGHKASIAKPCRCRSPSWFQTVGDAVRRPGGSRFTDATPVSRESREGPRGRRRGRREKSRRDEVCRGHSGRRPRRPLEFRNEDRCLFPNWFRCCSGASRRFHADIPGRGGWHSTIGRVRHGHFGPECPGRGQRSRSPLSACAVIATIGVFLPFTFSSSRIAAVAVKPSIKGICTSMSTTSKRSA